MVHNSIAEIGCENFSFDRVKGYKANARANFIFFAYQIFIKLEKFGFIINFKS